MTDILTLMHHDYDWREAFGYAGEPQSRYGGSDVRSAHPAARVDLSPFGLDDVKVVEAWDEGENDGPPWVAFGQLFDGRWFFLSAGCDYTGWDCQAGGTATVAADRDELISFGLTAAEVERLGL